MAERSLRAKVHHCGVHRYAPTWMAGIGVCSCLTTVCRTADDGYHLHEIRIGDDAWSRIVITEHLHIWMGDDQQVQVEHGSKSSVCIADVTLADVWPGVAADEHNLTNVALPDVECSLACMIGGTR